MKKINTVSVEDIKKLYSLRRTFDKDCPFFSLYIKDAAWREKRMEYGKILDKFAEFRDEVEWLVEKYAAAEIRWRIYGERHETPPRYELRGESD